MNLSLLLLFLPSALPLGDPGQVSVPSPGVVPEAEALIRELACLNCHASSESQAERFQPKRAPLLENVGARRSANWIQEYLQAPHELKPGTSMPELLASYSAHPRKEMLSSIADYLVSLGGPLDRTPHHVTREVFESGRQKFHELGCIACHAPQESFESLSKPFDLTMSLAGGWDSDLEEDRYVPDGTLESPDVSLAGLAERTTVPALMDFLLDPLSVRPSGRMPNLNLTEREAEAIAAYLLREQALESQDSEAPGMRYAYYEVRLPGGVFDLGDALPTRTGVMKGEFESLEDTDNLVDLVHRGEHFAFVFTGVLKVEKAGTYTFRTESDDGSAVFVNGVQVVDNGGFHAVTSKEGSIELEPGSHSIRITYFEGSGGNELRVHWRTPGADERPLRGDDLVHVSMEMKPTGPSGFSLDANSVSRGREDFIVQGCVQCHEPDATTTAPPLDRCDPTKGCLAPKDGTRGLGVPLFSWSSDQESSVREFLGQLKRLPKQTDAERVRTHLAENRCYACHRRDDVGGPHPNRGDYFASLPGVDLGEEGRLPPLLDAAGSKLHRDWLHGVLQEGATARPGLLTRMPQFNHDVMAELEEALVAADAVHNPPVPAAATLESVAAGRRLSGTQGFGCIQCHEFNGYPSLGINAVDLGTVTERIQYPWFRKLMEDPVELGMNSRMPLFWIDGKSPLPDVLDGDVTAQIDALWNYLAMGDAMQLPAGLNVADSAYELEIAKGEAPKLVGVFMKGLSPRVVAVGTGDLVHYAFDVENSRLALAWRGRFFNARGTWEGRAGKLEFPPTQEVFELPPGAPFALLGDPDAEWPTDTDRSPALRVRGRRFDKERRPVFLYALGDIDIEEAHVTMSGQEGSGLTRRFKLKSPAPVEGLYYQTTKGRLPVIFRPDSNGGYSASFEDRITW